MKARVIKKRIRRYVTLRKDALAMLREQETIVRCKDCKHYDTITGICNKGNTHGYADTWYCADGEKAVKWDE